jgi:hypothetical protein
MSLLAACHGDNCVLAEHCERHEVHQSALEGERITYVLPERRGAECELFVATPAAEDGQ